MRRFFHQEDLEKADQPSFNPKVRSIAESYAHSQGMKLEHPQGSVKANPERATRIAQAYHQMEHKPHDPKVKAAYDALKQETLAQFKHLKAHGLKISRMQPGQENPYKTSKDMHRDVAENHHLWYYPTEQGFGSGEGHHADHPMLEHTGQHHDGKPLLANDIFRIVHDYMGHAKEGTGFGAHGEENAWREHMKLFSPLAQRALTTETRGQNSWVNFGPHADHNRQNPAQTIYAEQKAGLMPEWTMEQDKPKEEKGFFKSDVKKAKKIAEIAKAKTMEKIAQIGHAGVNAGTSRVGPGELFEKENQGGNFVTSTQSIDNGGLTNPKDKKDERKILKDSSPLDGPGGVMGLKNYNQMREDMSIKEQMDQVPPKHRKAFEKAREDEDPKKQIVSKLSMLKSKLKGKIG